MKSHLPSLYQTKSTNERSQSGFTDLSYKISLINKSRVTGTTVELNAIIKELLEIYQNDLEVTSKFDQALQLKKNQFSSDMARYNQLENNYNTLKSNTSFINTLKNKNLKYQIDELTKSINEIDIERKTQHPPLMSVDPQSVINKNEDDVHKFLHLKELNYREYEALIYLLKKRALIVDKSDECIGNVVKEFNSLSNLIDLSKKLEEENKQLKNLEKLYIQDPLTKRQLFTRLSPYGNQSMIVILQSSIQNLYEFSKNLHHPFPMKEGQSFESVCTDQEFKQRDLSFKTESSDHNFVPLEEAIEQAQDQYDKMSSSEVLNCSLIPKNFFDLTNSRFDRLIKSNAELLSNMRNCHLRYERAIKEISDTTKQIMKLITEKRKFESFTSCSVFKFVKLNDDHIKLIHDQYNNHEKLKALEKLISAAGISLVTQPNPTMRDAVLNYLTLEGNSQSQTEKKKRKQSTLKSSTSSEINKSISKEMNLLCNQPPNIILSGLEIVFQITDFEQFKPKKDYLGDISSSLNELKNSFSIKINENRDFLKNQLDKLKIANAINLRKTLIDQCTNANLVTRVDNCVQTEDITKKK